MQPSVITSHVECCARGDLDAFDPLYRHFVTPIYSYLLRRAMDKALAEDLTSHTFLKAIERIHQYAPAKGPFAAWLYGIARNTLTDHFRSLRPHSDIEDAWDLSSEDDVQLDVHDRLQYRKIRSALDTLDPAKREIVLLRLWDGLSYQEISAITGKTETNCKVIFHRTLQDLRASHPLTVFLLLLASPFLS